MRRGDVIGPGADVEEPGWELGRIGAGVERPVVADNVAFQGRDASVPGGGDLAGHVVVAREGRRREVLDAILDPLHRLAGDDGGDDGADVARIDADLVPEAAADVGRHDADVVLRDVGDQGGDRAYGVRRLEGPPDGQFAVDLVHGGDAAAGLQRAGVYALIDDHLLGRDLRRGQRFRRPLGIADFPGEDVVVMLARTVGAFGLILDVFAQDRSVGFQCFEGIDHRRERFVVDLDQLDCVGRCIAVGGDDEGDLLILEQHLLVGQDSLHVAG